MAVKYELSTKIERNGKTRWHKLGVVMENDKGMYAIIDSFPVGFTGMVSFFEPKERDGMTTGGSSSAPKSINELTDDIPF